LALLAVLLGFVTTTHAADTNESAATEASEQATTEETSEDAAAAQERRDIAAAQVVVDDAVKTFKNFQADSKQKWFRDNVGKARGMLIVPRLGKGGFILAGSGGRGLLLARDNATGSWSQPAFYSMGSASIGFQIGAKEAEVILLVMTDSGLNSLLATKAQLGADASVAAGSIGFGAQAATPDILAFSRSQGIFGGISAEGTVIRPDRNRNRAYYGEHVTTTDILVRHTVMNTYATDLISSVTEGTAAE
jgi:lipid-binding SYLF domain-containing protein